MKAQEHRSLGDEASGGAFVYLGSASREERLELSFGDVVALSGDYFYPTAEPVLEGGTGPEVLASGGLFHLATVPGDSGSALGTRDEIICALNVMAADQGLVDRRFEPGGQFAHFSFSATGSKTGVEQRVRDRFLALGASNDDHFVAPGRRGPATECDRAVARFGSAVAAYRHLHRRALDEAWWHGRLGGELAAAMGWEAAAQHYLTDAFAAGHLRTPVAAMREFWQVRYPWFWERLQHKVAADIAGALRDLARPLRLLPPRSLHGRALTVVRSRTVRFPQVSLGDLLAKVFHDWDNTHGLMLEGGGMLFGDGCLDQGSTRKLALSACRAGIDDVQVAFDLGAAGRDLGRERLHAAVREATGADADAFVPECWVPRPSADNPRQNWWAGDVEALWDGPIVGSAGPTVGEAVSRALEAGEELPNRLARLGDGIADALNCPPIPGLRKWLSRKACQAYHRGFLDELISDPKRCVLEVVDAGARAAAGPPAKAA